ncbi:hypothetical protein DFQ27_002074 [Actinomortierella ambigua]|uniref:WHIM1 domain-containing protein n=1 Tax=Actinomortierella ambigua TaxID=1343610 RepID=A0A9P6Q8C1_9FUNG|nr:hypothetical protein DFQ27_002074 [Actinomortierella ambigua]
MAMTARMTRVSSRIAANQLVQQQQQEHHQQAIAVSSTNNSAAHSRAGSVSPRPGSWADSMDSLADDHQVNGQHYYRDGNGSHSPAGEDHGTGGGSGALDQGDKTTEIDHAAFQDHSVLSTWEFAFVYGFLLKFKQLLRQNYPLHTISEQDLEAALFATSTNDTLEQIHCNLLSNMQNRKKAVEKSSWQRALSEALDSKVRSGELEFQNPLRYYHNYYLIPPADRIQILKSLVDWVLQESLIIRQGLEGAKDDYLVQPFGTDHTKSVYWYFGEGSTKMYRESNPNKKNAKWETVASSLDDIRQLTDSLERTTSNVEKALRSRIQTEIIEPIEEKQLQERAERAEKKMVRLAKFHEMAVMRTTRTRSSNRTNVVKYNYDDDDEDDFEDGSEQEVAHVTHSRRGRGQQSQQPEPEPQPQPQEQPQEQEEPRQQEELMTGGFAMEMDVSLMPADEVSKHRAESVDEEDRQSDTSISIALERTRVGDITETDRSPKRMKIDVDPMPMPMPMPLPVPMATLLPSAPASAPAPAPAPAPARSMIPLASLLSDSTTQDTAPIVSSTTSTGTIPSGTAP